MKGTPCASLQVAIFDTLQLIKENGVVVNFKYIEGHMGHVGNEEADKLAQSFVETLK